MSTCLLQGKFTECRIALKCPHMLLLMITQVMYSNVQKKCKRNLSKFVLCSREFTLKYQGTFERDFVGFFLKNQQTSLKIHDNEIGNSEFFSIYYVHVRTGQPWQLIYSPFFTRLVELSLVTKFNTNRYKNACQFII